MIKKNYPEEPTDEAKVDSSLYDAELIGENDLGTADVVISVKTGEVFLHISVIITSMLLGSIVVFIVYTKIAFKRKKGGV